MNSLQKQNSDVIVESPDSFMSNFEKSILAIHDVLEAELLMKKLQFLGINFDPFQEENSIECQRIMEQLSLTQHMKNPYLVTNILLRLLDKAEERLNNLKQ